MVRRFFLCVFGVGLFWTANPGAAQTTAEDAVAESQAHAVEVLYRITFDTNFYFIAQSAGPYVWEDVAGPIAPEEMWYFSLEVALSNMPRIAQALRMGPGIDPVKLGVKENIPLLLEIQVSGSLEAAEVSIAYQIRETFTAEGMLQGHFTEAIPQPEDLLDYFWLSIAEKVDTFAIRALKPLVEIRGKSGTVVSGFSPSPQEIPDTGSLFLEVPIPGSFSWKALHQRYMPLEGIFLADPEQVVLELPQRRFYPFSLDLGLVQSRSPDIWFSWQPKPHGVRLSLGVQQQILGLVYLSTGGDSPVDIRSLWLPGMTVAYRLPIIHRFSHPFVPQLFFAGTVLGRVYDLTGTFALSLGSVQVSVGYDWEIPRGFRVFAELGFGFAL
ncbi:MAG: hypothetical protein LBQ30_04755, partial [Treponema sp.]|nr:hypothetical protein [Treponema sp.]